jgi:hypothetical protein
MVSSPFSVLVVQDPAHRMEELVDAVDRDASCDELVDKVEDL